MPVRLISQEELPSPLQGYKLIERLGRGGFGEVWKVEAPGGLLKAAKFVFGDLGSMGDESRAAEQELKALGRVRTIRHPYILSLERFDQIDGQLIIVMELADRNLWDRFRECRGQGLPGIPREELLRYMEEAAEALDLMNTHYQIQHLDIKPQNLFLVHNHIKVADFGLAKVLEGVRATVTGGVTPVYAAPETFEGWVSRFSDQYSLAIVFQELLTGQRPFNGANTRQLLMQHISGSPDLSSLPAVDQPIIGRALEKLPDNRWPLCTDLVRALRQAGGTAPPSGATVAEMFLGGAPSPVRPDPGGGGVITQLAGQLGGPLPNAPDSVQATRMALGGSGGLGRAPGSAPVANAPAAGPVTTPGVLPPLVKPSLKGPANAPPPLSGFAPRLVTPSSSGGGQTNTLNRPVIFQTGRMGSLGIAPPPREGDGVLIPALVVGLGDLGKRVVEQLKQLICDRFGSTEKVPNVQFLLIDTDPEAVPSSTPDNPAGVQPREAILARLNRTSHYLQRDSLPPIDPWMPAGAMYKLGRTPGAAEGVRAFGRLALIDNYRVIAQRIRQEIEAFLTDNALATATKSTGLELRSNRPKAYIVTGLGGGSGGGMFLDLAYLLRHEFRQVGYLRPEVAGFFFTPPAERATSRTPALGNALAALTELSHFQGRRSLYQTTFDKAEPPVLDSEPPFARVNVLPLHKAVTPKFQSAAAGLAARALYNELLTPVGRIADDAREARRKSVPQSPSPACQTFGLFRLTWPRPEMLATATRRFAQRQLQRWTAKEAGHLREPISAWLADQWVKRGFDIAALADSFREAVRESLREDPDKVFDAFVHPLGTRTPSKHNFDAAGVCSVFDKILKMVGKPPCENDSTPAGVEEALSARYDQVLRDVEGHVGEMVAKFLEEPQFRIPGAEEVVRQITERMKQQLEGLEPVRNELDKEVTRIYGRLFQVIGTLGSTGFTGMMNRMVSTTAEVLDLLAEYPRKRLKLHVADRCISLFRKLLSQLPEYQRDINTCRASLVELQATIVNFQPPVPEVTGGKLILPPECPDLDAAADVFLASLAPEDLLKFEEALQKEIRRKLKGLGSVCLHPNDKGPVFREILLQRSRDFLDGRLDHSDPAMMFFRYRTDDGSAEPLIGEAYEESAPDLTAARGGGAQPFEICILGAPPGAAGDQFRELVARVVPDANLTHAPLPDDICFYREYPDLPMADLPQFGPFAQEAYHHLVAGGHPPHTRGDIPWQLPPQPPS